MTDKDVAVWQATEAFYADGMMIQVGDTVAAKHPILKGRDIFFRPFTPTYDHVRDKAAVVAALSAQQDAEAAAEAEAVAAQEAQTVKDILAAVGDDPVKAAEALEVEKAGKNRVTLVEALEAMVAEHEGNAEPEKPSEPEA